MPTGWRLAVLLVALGSAVAVLGLVVPHATGRRDEWYAEQLELAHESDRRAGRDPGPGPAVGGAMAEGGCCLSAVVFYPYCWWAVALVRRVGTMAGPVENGPDRGEATLHGLTAAGWGVTLALFDFAADLPVKGVGDLLVTAGFGVAVWRVWR